MRQSTHNTEIISFDGQPAGISLGFNFTAEHQQGIAALSSILGTQSGRKPGLHQFKVSKIPANSAIIGFYEREKATKTIAAETRLVICIDRETAQEMADPKSDPMRLPSTHIENGKSSRDLAISWNKNGLCIRAFGDQERQILAEIKDALHQGDVLINLGGGANPFSLPGLNLTILSRIPQSVHDEFAAMEKDAAELQAAAEATSIYGDLEAAGCHHHALKPKWAKELRSVGRTKPGMETSETHQIQTSHPVVFFLNPRDQRNNNYGWFTVEELQLWSKGEGPIPKKAA